MPPQIPKQKNLFREALLPKERKKIARRLPESSRRIPAWVLLSLWGIFLLSSVGMLVFTPWLRVREVKIEGETVSSREELKALVTQNLSGKTLKVFPRDNLLFFGESKIKNNLLVLYPKLASVEITRHFPDRMVVSVEEKPYLIRWCSGGPCALIADEGRLAYENGVVRDEYAPWTLSIIDKSATPFRMGETLPVLPYRRQLAYFYEKLPVRLGIQLEARAETPTRYAAELKLADKEGRVILINTAFPPEETMAVLLSVWERGLDSKKREQLSSIDLRVRGKAFIAYKNGTTEIAEEEAKPVEAVKTDEKTTKEEKKKSKNKDD